MKIERTYPLPSKPHFQHQQVIRWAKWPFLAAAYLCPILNLALGGKPWSLVVLWSLWIAWSSLVSPDMVAYNRISQLAKLLFQSCVLLILIDLCLAPGWAVFVVPLVSVGGMIAAAALLFSDLRRQKLNMMPMFLLCLLFLFSALACLVFWPQYAGWARILMGAVDLALLVAFCAVLGRDFLRNLQKYFHIR